MHISKPNGYKLGKIIFRINLRLYFGIINHVLGNFTACISVISLTKWLIISGFIRQN